jgi:plasmid stabilization system protein ParE
MFSVHYPQQAIDDIADLLAPADAARRQAITDALRELDRRLQNDPHGAGESRDRGRRIAMVLPVAVIFRVEPDDRRVTVLAVRGFRKRGT